MILKSQALFQLSASWLANESVDSRIASSFRRELRQTFTTDPKVKPTVKKSEFGSLFLKVDVHQKYSLLMELVQEFSVLSINTR